MFDNLVQCMKVISERSICSNCQKCWFLMIWKDKFNATKIWYNIFSQFCWLNWNDKLIELFFYKYINFALFICIIYLHYHIELTWSKNISSCERELSHFHFWQAFDLRCLIILNVLDSSIVVEWSRILRQFLHEILEYSFNVKIIWINLFQMLNCLFTSIFLVQSKLFIFL